jgi:hypothetical protein
MLRTLTIIVVIKIMVEVLKIFLLLWSFRAAARMGQYHGDRRGMRSTVRPFPNPDASGVPCSGRNWSGDCSAGSSGYSASFLATRSSTRIIVVGVSESVSSV